MLIDTPSTHPAIPCFPGEERRKEEAMTTLRGTREGSARWGILGLAWLLYFGFAVTAASLVPIITPVRQDLDLTYSQVGIILGTWQLVYIGAALPVGSLIDRYGAKPCLFVGMLLIATSAAARGLAVDFWTLVLAVALLGLGGPVISIGLPKLIAQWFTDHHRATASGIYVTGSQVGNVAVLSLTNIAVLPLVGHDWRTAMFLFGALCLTIAVGWLLLGRDTAPTGQESSGDVGILTGIRQVVRVRGIWPVMVIGMSGFIASHGFRNWLPQILESKGADADSAGMLAGAAAIAGIGGSVIVMRLVQKVTRRTMAQILLTVTGLTLATIPYLEGPVLVGVLIVESFTAAALMPLMMNTLMEMPQIGPGLMGAAGGLYFSIGEVGGFLGPALIGLLVDLTGDFAVGVLLVAVIMLVMVIPAQRLQTGEHA